MWSYEWELAGGTWIEVMGTISRTGPHKSSTHVSISHFLFSGWKGWWQPADPDVEVDRACITWNPSNHTEQRLANNQFTLPKLSCEKKLTSILLNHNIFQSMSYHNLIYHNAQNIHSPFFAIVIEPLFPTHITMSIWLWNTIPKPPLQLRVVTQLISGQ